MIKKLFLLVVVKTIIDCDNEFACPSYSTCCKIGGNWGCCGIPDAICCPDNLRCVKL